MVGTVNKGLTYEGQSRDYPSGVHELTEETMRRENLLFLIIVPLFLAALGGCSSSQETSTTPDDTATEEPVESSAATAPPPAQPAEPSEAPRQECVANEECAEVSCDCDGHAVTSQGCVEGGCMDERDCQEVCDSADIHEQPE